MSSVQPPIRLDRFRDLAPGGDAAVRELIRAYLEHVGAQLDELRVAVQRGRTADVQMLAHRCGGTSATCGVDGVAAPLLALEALARTPVMTETEAMRLVDEAAAAFARAREFLTAYVTTADGGDG